MRLVRSFPIAFVVSVAFGIVYFAAVFGLLAHFRQASAGAPAFPVLLLLWLSPGLLCVGFFAIASRPIDSSDVWFWVKVSVLGIVVPFIALNLYGYLGTFFLILTGGTL